MKEPGPYLLHIRDAIARIESYTVAGQTAFLDDSKTQDAVLRNLEVIGEAVKQLPEPFKAANPAIPWRRIAGMRDKLIHEYFGVNLALVWEVVARELPAFKAHLDRIGR